MVLERDGAESPFDQQPPVLTLNLTLTMVHFHFGEREIALRQFYLCLDWERQSAVNRASCSSLVSFIRNLVCSFTVEKQHFIKVIAVSSWSGAVA